MTNEVSTIEKPTPTPDITDGSDASWITAGRPGYAGRQSKKRRERFDKLYGPNNWRVCHLYAGRAIDRTQALELYEEAYLRHFQANPALLEWVCATASDVYDTEPSNVDSGLDYFKQESFSTHLQDIAVRRCLKRLGRSFAGDHLVQIRGHESEGYRLNPGKVPFHDPAAVVRPGVDESTWWDALSVEDFWQSNKILQLSATLPADVIRNALLKPLTPKGEGGRLRVAIYGGSFNPIHLGHLRIAQDLLDLYGFDRVIFVPNGNGYRKRELIDEAHRARMIELAIAGEPRFELSRFEHGRTELVHTDQTVAHVLEQLSATGEKFEACLVRGSDVVAKMLRWRSLPTLLRCTILVIPRPGSDPADAFAHLPPFRLHADRFRIMPRPHADALSSTLIRDRRKAGHSARYQVPDPIVAYMDNHHLYA